MSDFSLHPNVYSTGGSTSLLSMLERIWVRELKPGKGTIYIISGFATYNGGVRFFETFRQHVQNGGKITVVFGGSTAQKLSSIQIVEEMLNCGADVFLINRKRLLHAKCYGVVTDDNPFLIVSSGNFTGPGMTQNVEASVLLEPPTIERMGFSWSTMIEKLKSQNWDIYKPSLSKKEDHGWNLLYDESSTSVRLDQSQKVTMLLLLGHSDTARINAPTDSSASKGTQYFWLSKDAYDFFPLLTIRNKRGTKATYSCIISLNYVDLGIVDKKCRVTFEAENNFDFRVGTGKLKNTNMASDEDLAAITRVSELEYELRIIKKGTTSYNEFLPHAINFIGHRGKKYGYIDNEDFRSTLGI